MAEIWTKRAGPFYDAFEFIPGLWVQPYTNMKRLGITRKHAERRLRRARDRRDQRAARRQASMRREGR